MAAVAAVAAPGAAAVGAGGGRGPRSSSVAPDGGPARPPARPPAAGRPEPARLSRSPAVMVADQRLPRVPAEPGTIPRLCALLLGARETKRKCQEHVNQTRYSVTITSLSGLPGPGHPRRTPRTAPTPARAPRARPAARPALRAPKSEPGPGESAGPWEPGKRQARLPAPALPDRSPAP